MTERALFSPIADPRPNDAPWPEMVWPPPVDIALSGSFVELRPFEPAVGGELFAALDHPQIWRHLPYSPRDASALNNELAKRHALGGFQWTVRLKRDSAGISAGTVVGMTSYLDVVTSDARLEIGGTAYAPAVWGGPVNPEAKLLLLRYAFEGLGVGRVQLKTDIRNHRSQQAIARLGASYEGTLRRHQRRHDATMRDSVLFSVIAEQWPEVRDRLLVRVASFL